MQELNKDEQASIDEWLKSGNKSKAAMSLRIPRTTLRARIDSAIRKGWKIPIIDVDVPESMTSTKTTVQYNRQGEIIQEWRRLQSDRVFSEDFVKALISKVKGKGKTPKAKNVKSDICTEICAYDLHFGMYASNEETGAGDYDTEIAAKRLMEAVTYLCDKTGKAKLARFVLGGDQLHADDSTNKTPNGGNVLDVDTRHALVIRKLVTACREAISHVCTMAEKVEIYVVAGNHDPYSSLWLAQVLEAYYSNCRNVEVCVQQTPRKYAVWGDCLSVYGHGDGMPATRWAGVVAAENARLWGETKYRYARLGHIHTKKTMAPIVVNEAAGLEVTYLSSLASSDAWHSQKGFIGNQLQAFELDKKRGQVAQYYYNV
jgi:hypothetical protein